LGDGPDDAEHLFVKDPNGNTRCVRHDRLAALCVPPALDDRVWRDTLDEGRYAVTVARTAPCKGLLTVVRDHRLVAEQPVSLMYNAEFGPDYEDVRWWQSLGAAAADADYRRRGEAPPR
jgi:hypothetical protein